MNNTYTHPLANLKRDQRIAKIREALSGWKDDPEIAEIFAEIDKERHEYQGRPFAAFNEEIIGAIASPTSSPSAEKPSLAPTPPPESP